MTGPGLWTPQNKAPCRNQTLPRQFETPAPPPSSMATSRKGGTKRGHFSKTRRTTCHSPVSFPFFFFKGGPRIRVMLRPVSHRLPGGKTQRPHLSSRAALPPSLRSTAGIKARATAEESQLQGGLERSGHLLTGQVRARAEQALVSLPPVPGIRLSPRLSVT